MYFILYCFQQLKYKCVLWLLPSYKTDNHRLQKCSQIYDKNAAIKCSYKPHGTKTPQSPLKVYSQTCCRRPQHNWVDAEWKSPLSNYLTMLWGRVERHVSQPVNFNEICWKKWPIDKEKLTDCHWQTELLEAGTCGLVKSCSCLTFPEAPTFSSLHVIDFLHKGSRLMEHRAS